MRRAEQSEDEVALRDAFHLGKWRSAIAVAAEALDLPGGEALHAAIDAAQACAACARPAPFAAARTFELVTRAMAPGDRGGAGELLAGWLADAGARPAAEMAVRAAPARCRCSRPRPMTDIADIADGAATARILFTWAKGAAHACDLSADLARRATRLAEARRNCARNALAAELRGVLGLGDEVEEDLGEEHVA